MSKYFFAFYSFCCNCRWPSWRHYLPIGILWMLLVSMPHIAEVVRHKTCPMRLNSELRKDKSVIWWYMLENFLIKIQNLLASWSPLFPVIFNFIIGIRLVCKIKLCQTCSSVITVVVSIPLCLFSSASRYSVYQLLNTVLLPLLLR